MRKIALFAALLAVLVLIGIDAWLSVRTLGPTDQLAGPTISPLFMPTSARDLLASHQHDRAAPKDPAVWR
jgi:hypothetical protein